MTKIQITAKAIWNGLFLYFLGYTLRFLSFILAPKMPNISYPAIISTFGLTCVCLILLIWGLHNISLPLRLTGTMAVASEQNWQNFFIQTTRLACVLVGLIFLSGSLEVLSRAAVLVIQFFPALRNWFTLWVEGDWITALKETATAIAYLFYPFGYLFFCGYLISGADSFIRRQLNLFEKYIIRESCNE
jgi:hypothetical protein